MVWDVIQLHEKDTVATAMRGIQSNQEVSVRSPNGVLKLLVTESIPEGHKVCLLSTHCGGKIWKFGQVIGVATQNISAGQHVHLHNLRSERGGVKESS